MPDTEVALASCQPASALPCGEVQLVPAAIDRWRFTEAGRLLYSYRLDAGSWSSFEDRTVFSLQGIASGSHTLQVRAMDRNFNVGPDIHAAHGFEVPVTSGVMLHDILTVFLDGNGGIDNVVNATGAAVNSSNQVTNVVSFP